MQLKVCSFLEKEKGEAKSASQNMDFMGTA